MRARVPVAARALDLLERDLLARTAGGDTYLVAGIVGPNNAGKSALFNALVGCELSPSVPAGGATRRLIGAAHPELLARLRAEPTLARFRLRSLGNGSRRLEEALQPAADPAELLVAANPELPVGLLLIDTPDFDSILDDNRLASESLLVVADLVVVVVTRHSYQNRAVVRFLEHWLAHGRPWMLVYNEAVDEAVAAAHAAKVAADVGTQPLAVFWAMHRMEIQRGEALLAPRRLSFEGVAKLGAFKDSQRADGDLRDLLFDLEKIAEVKSHAFEAAQARLQDALEEVSVALAGEVGQASAVLAAAEARALEAGVRVASAAMPAGPFVEAFRAVLDRRSNPLSRGWRITLRQLRLRLESLPALLRGRRTPPESAPAVNLAGIERGEVRKVWPVFWEELVRDLGHEARHLARQGVDVSIVELLDADLNDHRRGPALQLAEEALNMQPAGLAEFRRACEDLIEEAIKERGFDIDIQVAADVATLLPLALAAVVIVHTGGLGSDLAAAGGGAASAFLIEKYAHLLGASVMAAARRRWAELRGQELACVLIDAALPGAAPRLRTSLQNNTAMAAELRLLKVALQHDSGPSLV